MRQVLFICVGNSSRSQMAEAIFNHYAPSGWKAISAGTNPASRISSLAIKALAELGIDHSQAKLKLLTDKMVEEAERVVAVCSESEACLQMPPGKGIDYWQIPDPYRPGENQYLPQYRRARDLVKGKVLKLVEEMKIEN